MRKEIDDLGGEVWGAGKTVKRLILTSSVSYKSCVSKYKREKNERKRLSEHTML